MMNIGIFIHIYFFKKYHLILSFVWRPKTFLVQKFSVVQTNAIEGNKRLKYDSKSVAQTFAKFYSTLAESLLKNLPNSPKFSQI